MPAKHRVVVIGSGFGGLWATRRLGTEPEVEVTVIDRTTHHLFQPLLYQVATGILSEGEIAPPFRDIVRGQKNARVVLGEVKRVDLAAREVHAVNALGETVLPYDSLVVAAGMETSYFGHDEWEEHAPGLKTVADALELRARIFGAFELAELEDDPERRRALMTFVVTGAGPTGVEMAGQIAELAHRTLATNFRRIDPRQARIVLVDAVDKVLGQFGGNLPDKARATLEKAGVEIVMRHKVVGVDGRGVDLDGPDHERIDAATVVWGAGVKAVPLGRELGEQAGAQVNRRGQVEVEADCSLPGHPEVFVVGDLMALDELPGVAEVAMQSGRHAAQEIAYRLQHPGSRPRRFKYRDLGTLASIARYSAVGEVGPLRLSGFIGWVAWLVVHLTFLTGFKNRVSALAHWAVSFIGNTRSERTFTAEQAQGIHPPGEHAPTG